MPRRTIVAGLLAVSLVACVAWPVLAGLGAPAVAGPLTAASDSQGCRPNEGCVFDYVLSPAAAGTSSVSWHAYWTTTPPALGAARGFCTIDAAASLAWSASRAGAPLPARVFPPTGASRPTALLVVDAGGHASTPGRLSGAAGWPAGLIATSVHHGWVGVVWEGRTTRETSPVLAAEAPTPPTADQAPTVALPQASSIGVPCADVAPPGAGFLARLHPAVARRGQTSWLELRVPGTGPVWTAAGTESEIDATATVAAASVGGPFSRPETESFSDRISVSFPDPQPGRFIVAVTLRGPSGSRHYRLPLTVR